MASINCHEFIVVNNLVFVRFVGFGCGGRAAVISVDLLHAKMTQGVRAEEVFLARAQVERWMRIVRVRNDVGLAPRGHIFAWRYELAAEIHNGTCASDHMEAQ